MKRKVNLMKEYRLAIKGESVFNERIKELTGKCIQLERKWVGN